MKTGFLSLVDCVRIQGDLLKVGHSRLSSDGFMFWEQLEDEERARWLVVGEGLPV